MQLDQGEMPPVGVAEDMGDGLRRILAPNPSPMTFWGTNSYILGDRQLAVIDPGPDDAAHLEAILRAVKPGQGISHIFVTHAHLDHSPLAARLAERTGAPVLAFGDAYAGRSPVMAALSGTGLIGGGEGVDHDFVPDRALSDGETIEGETWRVTAYWTPGHFGNHMCFAVGDTVLTGDLVMGWASSLVSPPDGDLSQFMTSCARLQTLGATRFLPGHGAPITTPADRLDWLISHRRKREQAILDILRQGPQTATQIADRLYTDTPASLLPAASRNVLAHLIDLEEKSRATPQGRLSTDAVFTLNCRNGRER
ncbi:MBL fold metallo-hydrolase [uncultured Roseovarius sp.]|uniref:MBL fold metallo-hydrolase n=1 Tax=uncultured Roseovarius sp. TaxID=293344 RepID=UPI002606C3BD|nr:MBL fold metallo-hydrolase [uncultured Roseovarius sp.]